MRALLSFLVVLAFAAPSFAAENSETAKPVLIKGSKSYQVRYSKPAQTPAAMEPAAGVESTQTENQPAATAQQDDNGYGKKAMKLHGKK